MSRSKNPESYAPIAAQSALFAGIPEERVASLLSCEGISVLHTPKGESIFSPNGFSRSLGILLLGCARVIKRDEGNSMLMSVLEPGDLFGAATLFSGEDTYVAYIIAEKSAWSLMISEEALVGLMKKDFSVVENYMAYLTARIRFLSGRIDGFVQPSPKQRVLAFMKKNAVADVFTPVKSLQALADSLCISRATLYRAMDELADENVIIKDGRNFRIMKGETK